MTKSDRDALERELPGYLMARRWFRGKARRIAGAVVEEAFTVGEAGGGAFLVLVRVRYADGGAEDYVLMVARDWREGGGPMREATSDPAFCNSLLSAFIHDRRLGGSKGEMAFSADRGCRTELASSSASLEPSVLSAEQSNTSIAYGQRCILKLYRSVEPGVNPELEVGSFLTAKGFAHVPPVLGHIEYQPRGGEATVLGILQGFISNRGDGWRHARAAVDAFLDGAPSRRASSLPSHACESLLDLAGARASRVAAPRLGPYVETARLLGLRTAALHLALGSASDDPAFAPEPFSAESRQEFHDAMVDHCERVLALLSGGLEALPGSVRDRAREVLGLKARIVDRFRPLLDLVFVSSRIRCHGDYHLGQVIYTGSDFVITDFEGEVARPLRERRAKSSPLRDVAGMLRSFHYAAYAGLLERNLRPEERAKLEPWARAWHVWSSAVYLEAYLEAVGRAPFFPRSREELAALLDAHILEKAIYEVGYELNNRPAWLAIPLEGVRGLMGRT